MTKYKNNREIYCEISEQYVMIAEIHNEIQTIGNPFQTEKFSGCYSCSNKQCQYQKLLLVANCPNIDNYLRNEN